MTPAAIAPSLAAGYRSSPGGLDVASGVVSVLPSWNPEAKRPCRPLLKRIGVGMGIDNGTPCSVFANTRTPCPASES